MLTHRPLNTVVLPCDLGGFGSNIYGSSIGWLENTKVDATLVQSCAKKNRKLDLYGVKWP